MKMPNKEALLKQGLCEEDADALIRFAREHAIRNGDYIEGMCCDCKHGGPCCDYRENIECDYYRMDGSCWHAG